jgi:hypothetical protein
MQMTWVWFMPGFTTFRDDDLWNSWKSRWISMAFWCLKSAEALPIDPVTGWPPGTRSWRFPRWGHGHHGTHFRGGFRGFFRVPHGWIDRDWRWDIQKLDTMGSVYPIWSVYHEVFQWPVYSIPHINFAQVFVDFVGSPKFHWRIINKNHNTYHISHSMTVNEGTSSIIIRIIIIIIIMIIIEIYCTYCGWLRNPAPVDKWFIPIIIGFQPYKLMQDFATIHSMLYPLAN